MTIDELLWSLETRLWTEDDVFHAQHLADDCLLLLPQPAGVLTKDMAVASLRETPRWSGVRFGGRHSVMLHERIHILAYTATAHRRGDPVAYRALVSSTYVNRNGDWKLVFHQQTPDDASSGATGRFQRLPG